MTASEHPQRCDHECVCKEYREWYEEKARVIDEQCPYPLGCDHYCVRQQEEQR